MNALSPVFRRADVHRVVEAQISAGERDPALVASNAADLLFRSRRCQVFPPPPGAPLSARLAWDELVGYVDAEFRRRGICVGDLCAPTEGVRWQIVSTARGSLDLERYPWETPSLHQGGEPVPSTFWRGRRGDDDATLVRGYLFWALVLAGADPALAHDDSKTGRRLRREAREVILEAPFNDARVTSTSATLAGGRDPRTNGAEDPGVVYVLGARGRGLVWQPRHYDDLGRLSAGLPAKRGVDLHGNPVGSGRSRMVLYLPAVSLPDLRGSQPTLRAEGTRWSDGRSVLEVPPAVHRYGIDKSGVEVSS